MSSIRICLSIVRFSVTEQQVGLLVLAFAATLLVSLLSVMLPAIKSKVTKALFGQKRGKSSLLVAEADSDSDDSDKTSDFRSKG